MRHMVLIFLVFSVTSLGAQSMSFSPNVDLYGTAILENYSVYQIDVLNETEDSLQLSWKFVENTTPEEWTITLCDNMNCYGYIPLSGIMNPILEDPAFIKLDINPHSTPGEGIVTFEIFETEDQSVIHEIRFHISTTPVSNENYADIKVEIFPNPASDFVVVEHSQLEKYNISITNANGQPVYLSELPPNEKREILTNDFANGIYYLSFLKDQAIISTKKILINH